MYHRSHRYLSLFPKCVKSLTAVLWSCGFTVHYPNVVPAPPVQHLKTTSAAQNHFHAALPRADENSKMASLAAFAPSVAALRPKVAKTSKVAKAVVAERRTETVVPAISTRRALLGGAVSAAMTLAMSPGPAAAKDGKNGVYWIAPKDGATVGQEFDVKMGVIGYELAPASEGLQEGTGHHHIVVDQAGGYVDKGTEIPFDATHLHYGKAQKDATIKLEPGTHTLTLQFANAKHMSYGKKFAKTITVTVV